MSDGVQIRPPSEWKERTFEDDMRDTRTKIMQAILDERKKIENHKKGVIRSNLRIEKLQKRSDVTNQILQNVSKE